MTKPRAQAEGLTALGLCAALLTVIITAISNGATP